MRSAYLEQAQHLKKVWRDQTFGLERLVRLALCAVQFVFPVLLVRELSGRQGGPSRKIAVELYTLVKLGLPLLLLGFGLYRYRAAVFLIVYLMSETVLHILNLIFLEDIYPVSISYRRSILLLLMHYLEVVFDFAVIYIAFDLLSQPLSAVSAVYFSMVAHTTVGFGDIHAKGSAGQLVVVTQLAICVLFIILFINYFSQKTAEK